MNFRLTLTLVIVLAIVTSIAIILSNQTPEVKNDASVSALFNPKPGDIDSISLIQNGVDRYKFKKQGDQWKMTFPVNTTVDNDQLSPIASALQSLSFRQKFEPEEKGDRSPDATGVSKPRSIIKFADTAGKEYTLAVGKRGADNVSCFVTLNGAKTIYLLDTNPLSSLNQNNPDNFRNKTIKRVDETKITKINIKSKDDDITLTKSPDNKWLISAPISARANAAAVNDLINEFHQIQAAGFSTLSKETVGLAPPTTTITVWLQDSPPPPPSATATSTPASTASQPAATPITLQLGFATDLFDREHSPIYAGLADSTDVFTLRHDSVVKLTKTLKDIRDPAITPAAVTSATKIEIGGEQAPALTLERKDNWSMKLSDSLTLPADGAEIGTFLDAIRDMRAINYVDHAGDLKSIGLDPPRMRIKLTVPGQTRQEEILVGKPETGETAEKVTPMMLQGETTVYLVQNAEGKKLDVTALNFRDRTVDRLLADRIRSISFAGPGATATSGITLKREGTRWTVTGLPPASAPATTTAATSPATPAEPPTADEIKISNLLAEFTPLMATKYLNESPDISGTPAVTVTLSILEPTIPPPAPTPPATLPTPTTAPSTNTSTSSAPSSSPATAPAVAESRPALLTAISAGAAGPDPGKLITRTLKIYKAEPPTTTTAPSPPPSTAPATAPSTPAWKAVWDGQSPAWTFEPNSQLLDHITRDTYVTTPAATQPTTRP